MAQREGLMDITRSSATYLGSGWSSCTPQQEDAITVRHHLTMTTGIGFDRGNDNCTTPDCLRYRAAPGTIWDYHNACYLLLQDMVEKASNTTYQLYYTRKLAQPLGMGGIWFNGTLYSKPLAMARFGLMLLAGGVWNGDTIIKDRQYFDAMVNTSQQLNKSYGYLFWLNGKGSYMQPSIPIVWPSDLVPSAPKDMYAGMGKNDQRVYVVPSQRMVVVRMGNPGDTSAPAISGYDDALWRRINNLPCNTSVNNEQLSDVNVWPNPAATSVSFSGDRATLYDLVGNEVLDSRSSPVDVSTLPSGVYHMVVTRGNDRSGLPLVVR
jgi:CubicO group peptidase (beta-lactamase class C family)